MNSTNLYSSKVGKMVLHDELLGQLLNQMDQQSQNLSPQGLTEVIGFIGSGSGYSTLTKM